MRLYVMYGCNKALLIALFTLFGAELITETMIVGLSTAKESSTLLAYRRSPGNLPNTHTVQPLPALPNITGCITSNTTSYQWAYWLPALIFELILFSLAVLKSVQVYRARKNAGETPSILVILIRDSVLYFAGIAGVIFTNLITWAVAPVGNVALPFYMLRSLTRVTLGYLGRSLLHICQVRSTL